MLQNDTLRSILERRSYKAFQDKPIDPEILKTIVEAGQYAPTGMNRQPWHFTVIASPEARAKFTACMEEFIAEKGPFGPPPGVKIAPPPPGVVIKPDAQLRGAPVCIIVSGDPASPCYFQDCLLATENLYIAAASFGIMSGWTNMTVKDFLAEEKYRKAFDIPEGYIPCSASFFGYPEGETKDRGPRKDGTVTWL